MPLLTLYNQCRSGPSFRVRIALALKGVAYVYVAVDLRAGAQRDPAFLALNPQGFVPALKSDGRVLTQSAAIIEWLEERFPIPSILPPNAWDRALVRSMAGVIGADVQPINNLRVQAYLRDEFGAGDKEVRRWSHRWIGEGFEALERLVELHGGAWCFGDSPSLVDIHLVPQAAMARRLGFDIAPYPRLAAIEQQANAHPAFAAARPEVQPDWS